MRPTDKTQAALDRVVEIIRVDTDKSYRQACEDAGVSYRTAYRHLGKLGRPASGGHVKRRITPEQIINALRKADKSLGRKASSRDFQKQNFGVSAVTVFRMFGTWDAARAAAGLEPINWRLSTRD